MRRLRVYRFSRAPFDERRDEREKGKLRRSYTHPRAGASRHLARPVPVPDWSVVRSRAFRRSSSSSSSSSYPRSARNRLPVSSPRRVLRAPLCPLLSSSPSTHSQPRRHLIRPLRGVRYSSLVAARARYAARLEDSTRFGRKLSSGGRNATTFPGARG